MKVSFYKRCPRSASVPPEPEVVKTFIVTTNQSVDYSTTIRYVPQLLVRGKSIKPKFLSRLQIDPNHPSYHDHDKIFSQEKFKYPYLPLYLGEYQFNYDLKNTDINVLRLLIRQNSSLLNIELPKEIEFAEDFIIKQINYHWNFYPENRNCFIYLTIRCCTAQTCYYDNAKSWHIDGFQGTKLTRHIPEQQIFWSNVNPTEFLLQPFFIDGLDPSKHNIHGYFQNNANDDLIYKGIEQGVYLINPYNIHRASKDNYLGNRIFVRLTFSPVVIDDPTNTLNPNLNLRKAEQREEIRDHLWNYKINEMKNQGFVTVRKSH